MSGLGSLLERVRSLPSGGSPTLPERLDALRLASATSRGRLDDVLLDRADAVLARADGRLAISGDHTVVALAGATGSGKSSLYNAVIGTEVAQVGVRRPTTSVAAGCAWGAADASPLFEHLGVLRRHSRPTGREGTIERDLTGLVLLDLPDHDSDVVAHQREVDRLVQLVDVMAWVVDPQKYADAVLHERYLRPLATHREVMLVLLNQVDLLGGEQREQVLGDLRRRLAEDGLDGVEVLAVSARTGDGVPDLRRYLADKALAKRAAAARLTADVIAVARDLEAASGSSMPPSIPSTARERLTDAFADAAGVPAVVAAVEGSTLRRGHQHTGWPVTAWLSKLKPDPLKRLHLDLGQDGKRLTKTARASLPAATPVQRAQVDGALRGAADAASVGLAPAWAAAVRRAAVSRSGDISDGLDRAVVGVDLGQAQVPFAWKLARALQVAFALVLLSGVLWLAGLAVTGWLRLPEPSTPSWSGIPVPTLLLLAGIAGGLALGVLGGLLNRFVARSRARAADRALRAAVAGVAQEAVLEQIESELAAYRAVAAALAVAVR